MFRDHHAFNLWTNDHDAVLQGESSSPELRDPSSVGWNRMGKCKSTNFRSFENANESGNRCTKTILKLDRDSAAERRPSMMERNPTARTIEVSIFNISVSTKPELIVLLFCCMR